MEDSETARVMISMEQMMGDMDIAFPHLGIYLRNVPKTIMVGSFGIAIYGILVASAMLIGISIAAQIGKKTGQDPDLYWDSFVWIVISAIAGARASDPTNMVPIFGYSLIAVALMLLIDLLTKLLVRSLGPNIVSRNE